MGPSDKCILEFHRTFRWLPSSAERRLELPVEQADEADGAGASDGRRSLSAVLGSPREVRRCQSDNPVHGQQVQCPRHSRHRRN